MVIQILSLKDAPGINAKEIMDQGWAPFMTPDKTTMQAWRRMKEVFPEYQLSVFVDGKLAGLGNSVPTFWSGLQEDLPSSWAETFSQAIENYDPEKVNTLAAVNIAIHADYQNTGLSRKLLTSFKELVYEKRLRKLIVPARPSFKANHPLIPLEEYIHSKREDGTPFDPWIRTHWRLGATIVKPFPNAFTAKGTIQEWESWTGMRFAQSGAYIVKGALQPVRIDIENDLGVYEDPHVWMEYE
jgi:GNAT superfamily N-acetyltransferase